MDIDDGQALQGLMFYADADQDGYRNPSMPLNPAASPVAMSQTARTATIMTMTPSRAPQNIAMGKTMIATLLSTTAQSTVSSILQTTMAMASGIPPLKCKVAAFPLEPSRKLEIAMTMMSRPTVERQSFVMASTTIAMAL